jgi:hypothetical protein
MSGRVGDPIEPRIRALVEQGLNGKLLLCVGAGVSQAEPTGLPSARALAGDLHALFGERIPRVVEVCGQEDLECIADVVDEERGGRDFLRERIVRMARFKEATPNHAHTLAALLLAEGFTRVLTLNWDTCIERALRGEQPTIILTMEDRIQSANALLIKIHGCATRPPSLLVSTEDLEGLPLWSETEIGNHLTTAIVVFLGCSSIPTHSARRVRELVDDIQARDRVKVVTTGGGESWQGLLGDAVDDALFRMTADDFADELARAYIDSVLMELALSVRRHVEAGTFGEPFELAHGHATLDATVKDADARGILEWVRSAGMEWECGRPILLSSEMTTILLALCLMATSERAVAITGGQLHVGALAVEVLCANKIGSTRVLEEGRRRVELKRGRNEVPSDAPVMVLCAGHEGPLPPVPGPRNVVAEEDPTDVVGGPLDGELYFVPAPGVVGGLMPEIFE